MSHYIYALIALLGGSSIWFFLRNKNLSALLQNPKVTQELEQILQSEEQNTDKIAQQAVNEQQLSEESKKALEGSNSLEELNKFFNDPNTNK